MEQQAMDEFCGSKFWILASILLTYNKKHGMRTSGLLFLFWFSLVLCGCVQYRVSINVLMGNKEGSMYLSVCYMIYYPIIVILFILNFLVDAEPRFSEYPTVETPCPEQSSSFPSRILFAWFDALAWKGFRKPLETSDLWSMNPEDMATEIVPKFDKYWNKSLIKRDEVENAKASYRKASGQVDFNGSQKKKIASILPPICKAFGATFTFGAFLKMIQDIMTFISPQILKLLIAFIEGEDDIWKGYFYSVLLLLTAVLQTLILSQYFHRMFLVGLRIRTALIAAIYRKALRLSNASRKESTLGEIVNLMSVDAQRFMDLTAYINMIWSAPLQIALALYFLWDMLGPAVLAGLAVMIILIPINGLIANKVKTLQIKQMKNKDERVKLMNEVLNGIKVLKLYAWEPSFEQQILKIRVKEIQVLKEAAYLNAGTSFIWSCAPFLVALVSFTTYVLIDETNVLNSTIAFVSLSLFNILRFPLSMLPMMIGNIVQTYVSVKRINKFMNMEELDPNNVQHDPLEAHPLVIENGNFSWDNDPVERPILQNINFHAEQGQLVAIVGTVGSGKSSLLSALLGEMEKLNGKVNTKGSIAYVSQQPWIQNATLQDNVLFGKALNKSVYNRIIEGCALSPDLKMLPAGDQTEIGEKGINLSGGQKQRVALARAVYNDSENYFLDDPLSAVDSHVGKHIFENVIGPNGLLKKKTRILVTHSITYLPEVDNIIVLNDGVITETGTYKQLLERKGAFAEFLVHHLQDVHVHDGSEEDLHEIKQQLESTIGADELQHKLTRVRSRMSESLSESGSMTDKTDRKSLNGSLKRQYSTESQQSTNYMHSNSTKEKETSKPNNTGEKLIEVEKAETGSVKWKVYSHYLQSIGWFLSISTIVMNAIFQAFSIGSNIWLSRWSNDNLTLPNGTIDTPTRDMYLGIYGVLGFGQAIFVVLSQTALVFGCLQSSKLLHSELLFSILRSPLGFFDTTPSGRILNRLGKDIDIIDNILPPSIRAWLFCLASLITVIVVGVSIFTMGIFLAKGTTIASSHIFQNTMQHVLRNPMSFFDTTPTGRILSRLGKDIDIVDNALPNYLPMASFFCDLAPQLGCWLAARQMHIMMLRAVMRAPLTFFDTTPIGRIISRFAKDVDILDTSLPAQISDTIYCLFEVIATLFVISYSTPIFIVVILPVGAVYYFIQRFYVATSRQLKRLESVSRSPIYSHFSESVTGAQLIRAYGVQEQFIRESENRVDFNQVCYYPSIIANRWLAVRLEMVGNLIIFFAALFAVLGRNTMSSGLVGLSVSYALQITQTLNWLVRMTSDVETNIVAVERIKEYGETEQEAPWKNADYTPPQDWPKQGRVDFKDFKVRYREGLELVLHGLTFGVHGGEKIGIVGRTGAGKSSLTLSLFRIIEAAHGKILIDDIDISKMGLHDLRSRLTIIPQDPVLFSGTLRMNLDPFVCYSDDEIWTALEHAHLKSFVKTYVTNNKNFRVIVLDKGLIVEYDSPEKLLRNPSSSFYSMAKDAGLAA
ncbi:Multidrug resistance-associated protein 1 [Camponotus floridanus]|uniref:ABC-type glutathione-S-conjugate transporter n=1 Tax=Camponotus floridanus TaxID=104421 RepID=E2AUW0_CAMFO|nr:Multidrug resistance-associated protein 1 [Camponotus floridanus]